MRVILRRLLPARSRHHIVASNAIASGVAMDTLTHHFQRAEPRVCATYDRLLDEARKLGQVSEEGKKTSWTSSSPIRATWMPNCVVG